MNAINIPAIYSTHIPIQTSGPPLFPNIDWVFRVNLFLLAVHCTLNNVLYIISPLSMNRYLLRQPEQS